MPIYQLYIHMQYIYISLSLYLSLSSPSLSLHRLLEEFSQAKGVDIRIYIYTHTLVYLFISSLFFICFFNVCLYSPIRVHIYRYIYQ